MCSNGEAEVRCENNESTLTKETWMVIGSTGMAAYSTLLQLSARASEDTTILAVTRSARNAWLEGAPPGITVVTADIGEPESLRKALKEHPPVTHIFYSAVVRSSFDSSNKLLEKMDMRVVREMQRAVVPCMVKTFSRLCYDTVYSAFNSAAGGGDVEENKRVFENVLSSVDSSKLQYCCVVTGAKHYGMHLGPSLMADYAEPYEEDVGAECPGESFYDALEDSLRAFSSQHPNFSSAVLRPTFIIGPSPRTGPSVMNLSLALGMYALLSKELGLPLRFLGSEEAWVARHNLSHSDRIAELAISAGLNIAQGSHTALNASDCDSFSFQEIWPGLAAWAGCETYEGPQGRNGVSVSRVFGDVDLAAAWEAMADREGLAERHFDKLFNAVFLEQSMSIAHNCRLSSEKCARLAWAPQVQGGGWVTLQRALRDLQKQGLLPEDRPNGAIIEQYVVTSPTGLSVRRGLDMESTEVAVYPRGLFFSVLGRVNRKGFSRIRTADGWASEFSANQDRRLVEQLDPDRDPVEQLMAAMNATQNSEDWEPEPHLN